VDIVVYIPAYFKPLGGREVTVAVPTGEKRRTIFGTVKTVKRKQKQWRGWGRSKCRIDGERLAMDVEKAVRTLNSEGYEVVTIVPAISGAYNYRGVRGGWSGYGYGYGYSYTEGLIIVARKVT
jgi:hypothetical protein